VVASGDPTLKKVVERTPLSNGADAGRATADD